MACETFADSYIIKEPKFKSISFEYNLYCQRQWYKSLMINISQFASPIFVLFLMFQADKFGRALILMIMGPIGIIGSSIGLIFNNLIAITFAMFIMSIFQSGIFLLNIIYFNEIIIDPWRSKSSGIKTFSLTLGLICTFTFRLIPSFLGFVSFSEYLQRNLSSPVDFFGDYFGAHMPILRKSLVSLQNPKI